MVEEDYEILEEFGSLAECTDYYLDVLSNIKESHDKNILTKKEFKKKKKFVMKQFDLNLKVVKKSDSHQRKTNVKSLKKPVVKISEISPPQNNTNKIENNRTYQIEDKKGQVIKGQMDIEEINKGEGDGL